MLPIFEKMFLTAIPDRTYNFFLMGIVSLERRGRAVCAAQKGNSYHLKKRLLFLAPIYLLLFLILLDAFIAPYLESLRLPVSQSFYGILKPLCHQWPTRCLWIFGSNTALCSRCLGIFFALLMTGLYFGIKGADRIFWKTAILLNLPALIDGYTQLRGWRVSNNYLRLGTGLMAGVGAGVFLFPFYLVSIARLRKVFRKKEASVED